MHTLSLLLFPSIFTAINAATIDIRASSSCGIRGYDKSNSYDYDPSGANANLAACGTKCKADKKCKSFAFGGTECDLYTQTVTSNVVSNSTSPYLFYDVSCAGTTTSSSTAISSSSSSSRTSTTTSSSSPSSALTSTSSLPTPTLICGVAGYDRGTFSYSFDGSGANGNLNACSAKCQADGSCLSFAIGGGDCLLYSVTAASNLNPVSSSPYTFFDRSCPTGTTSSSTSSTTAITTSTISTSSSSATSTTSTGSNPAATFCLQLTGSGPPGAGYYAYLDPSGWTSFTSDPTNTTPPMLFTLGDQGVLQTVDNSVMCIYVNPMDPADASSTQQLQKVPRTLHGDAASYRALQCTINTTQNLNCIVGVGTYTWNQFALQDAGVRTNQILYLEQAAGAYDHVGLTVVDSALCPSVPDAPPPPPNGFSGTR